MRRAGALRALGVVAALGAAWPGTARAEWFEHDVGLEGLVVLPRLEAPEPTKFASAGFGARAQYSFGVLHDLTAVARFSAWLHEGQLPGVEETTGRGTFSGTLAFHGEAYRPEVGLRWKVLSGFNLAPHVEVFGGYQWTTFRGRDLRNARGGSFGVELPDVGRGGLTLGGGAALDYRLMNLLLVGVACSYSVVRDENYRGDLTGGASVTYYWF